MSSGWLMAVLVQGCILSLCALCALRFMKGSSASMRHRICGLAFLGLFLLPVLLVLTPTVGIRRSESAVQAAEPTVLLGTASTGGEANIQTTAHIDLVSWLPALWLAGFIAVLLRHFVGTYLASRSVRVQAEVPACLGDLQRLFGVSKPIRVGVSETAATCGPFILSWLRPALVLPYSWSEWGDERLRCVLAHEVAHVKRGDCGWQLIAALGLAVHWMNPLCWVLARRLRDEAELAADDLVLNAGIPHTGYASHLVQVVRGMMRRPAAAAVAMASGPNLEGRIARIMDPAANRTTPRGRDRVFHCAALAAAIAILVPCKFAEGVGTASPVEAPFAGPQLLPEPEISVLKPTLTGSGGGKAKPMHRIHYKQATKPKPSPNVPASHQQAEKTKPNLPAIVDKNDGVKEPDGSKQLQNDAQSLPRQPEAAKDDAARLMAEREDREKAERLSNLPPKGTRLYVKVGDEYFEETCPSPDESFYRKLNEKYWKIARRKNVNSFTYSLKPFVHDQ